MLDRGYLRVLHLRSAEVRIHWSVLAAAALAGRFRFEPVTWAGLFAIIVTHQLGHASAVALAGGTLLGLDTTGVGGSCRWRGAGTLQERAWVAWGGVLAQALLLGGALAFSAFLRASAAGTQLRFCFVELNLGLLALNLLPVPPLDGALAWRLFGALSGSRWRRQREPRWGGASGSAGWSEDGASPPSSASALATRGVQDPSLDPAFLRARSTATPRLFSAGVARGPSSAEPRSPSSAGTPASGAPRTPSSERYGQAATDDAQAEDEALTSPRPSEQAQREIDALLRRVEDRLARSRRGR